MRRAARLLLLLTTTSLAACASAGDEPVGDYHEHGDEVVGSTSEALSSTDTVATAVPATCDTAVVKGLATQMLDELECLHSGTMMRIDGLPGISTKSPRYLQTAAALSLVKVQKARGVVMTVNSGLRTLPEQYMLYRWYKTGRCGITLAASPGTSNHESGTAVDVQDNAGWRTAMQNNSWRWLGSSDPVHYDYLGPGTISIKGLSVLAFQRLWNRNHPKDRIAEDGSYGPNTEARLAMSPIGGFPVGALPNCGGDAGVADASVPDDDADVPGTSPGHTPDPSDGGTALGTSPPESPTDAPQADGGCSVARAPADRAGFAPIAGLALAALAFARRRRRAQARA